MSRGRVALESVVCDNIEHCIGGWESVCDRWDNGRLVERRALAFRGAGSDV